MKQTTSPSRAFVAHAACSSSASGYELFGGGYYSDASTYTCAFVFSNDTSAQWTSLGQGRWMINAFSSIAYGYGLFVGGWTGSAPRSTQTGACSLLNKSFKEHRCHRSGSVLRQQAVMSSVLSAAGMAHPATPHAQTGTSTAINPCRRRLLYRTLTTAQELAATLKQRSLR